MLEYSSIRVEYDWSNYHFHCDQHGAEVEIVVRWCRLPEVTYIIILRAGADVLLNFYGLPSSISYR